MSSTLTPALDTIGSQAAEVAMRAAADFLRARGLTASTVDLDALMEALRRHTRAAVGEALDDARAAHEAGLSGWVAATFVASFHQAGINAAKEVAG